VAVVGAGIVGLATAHELRERGVGVCLFESARPGAGQSAGTTRIFRHSHRQPEVVGLAAESRGLWDAWEKRFETSLLGDEGALVTGPDVRAHEQRLSVAGVPCRMLTEEEQREVHPALDPPGGAALLDELGGAIDVRAAVDALSRSVSGSLVLGRVYRIDERGSGVFVDSSEGVWHAERVVVCAGAEVRELAPGLEFGGGCHVRATFAVRPHLRGRSLPCLQEQSGEYGETVYGGPVPSEENYVIGLSGPSNEIPAEPGQRVPGRNERVDELAGRISRWVRRAMPGLDPEPVGLRLCITTVLPEGPDNFRIWREGAVTGLVGDNLFKFAPLLGRMLAGETGLRPASARTIPGHVVPSGSDSRARTRP